jgi:hypothetical protein
MTTTLPRTTETGLILPAENAPVFSYEDAFFQMLGGIMEARGTNTAGDVLTQTIDGRDLNEMWDEFQQAIGYWNQSRTSIVQALTFPVSAPVEDVPQAVIDDFEEASEFGVPKGLRGAAFFNLAYDFKWYDVAVRYTWMYLAEATSGQVDSLTNMVFEADNRLIFSKIMKAIFNNTNRATTVRQQSFTVSPFYNADGTVPPKWKNNATLPGSHSHYFATNNATLLPAHVTTMEDTIKHHGYGRQQGSTLILMVNSQELATIRSWRVATGAPYDFIPGNGQPPWLLPTSTGGVVAPQGGGVPSQVNGLDVVGRYGSWFVVEEDYIPAGYLLGFATGGENQATNPVGFRQHANAGLQGLRLVRGAVPDYPLIDSYYQRGFGTGVRHRGAGVVCQVKAGSATYDIPAEYV